MNKHIRAAYQKKSNTMDAETAKAIACGNKVKPVKKEFRGAYKTGGLVMDTSRQHMDNMLYDRQKKMAERYQEREHKDYDMMRHREHEDYEKRKKYEEARERAAHKAFEDMKRNNPKVREYMDSNERKEYKKGGCVQKFAAGGVAKIRHNQATPKGLPKNPPKAKSR